jgi:hypothetical protein
VPYSWLPRTGALIACPQESRSASVPPLAEAPVSNLLCPEERDLQRTGQCLIFLLFVGHRLCSLLDTIFCNFDYAHRAMHLSSHA